MSTTTTRPSTSRDLETVDFVCSSWGLKDIVHTLLTFGFRGGDHVVLSVVPRREKDEPVATNLGSLFKQYELIYILADECDVLRLRTNFRKENLYLFPGTATPEQARVLFMAVINRVNELYRQPRYYNLVTHNCTTSLVPLMETIYPSEPRWDWRYLLNANTVRMSYDDGHLATPLSFKQDDRSVPRQPVRQRSSRMRGLLQTHPARSRRGAAAGPMKETGLMLPPSAAPPSVSSPPGRGNARAPAQPGNERGEGRVKPPSLTKTTRSRPDSRRRRSSCATNGRRTSPSPVSLRSRPSPRGRGDSVIAPAPRFVSSPPGRGNARAPRAAGARAR